MRVRNTHCVELQLDPRDLAAALGHPKALVREAEVRMKDGKVEAVRVYLEYVIATKGVPKVVRKFEAYKGGLGEGHEH
jgi:hypothetical protein